jgi:hypothetical protein
MELTGPAPPQLICKPLGVEPSSMKPSILLSCIFSTGALFAADKPKHNTMSKVTGVVPDDATAIRIAVAVWEPIYGAKTIAAQKPFHAELAAGIWTVHGSLPKGWIGGDALAEISKAGVLSVSATANDNPRNGY